MTKRKTSGIYYLVATVKESSWYGKYYIGQDVDILRGPRGKRGGDHFRNLKYPEKYPGSENLKLKAYWNKWYPIYKEECFAYGKLLLCDRDELNRYEIEAINFFDARDNGFNANEGGSSGFNPDKCKSFELISPMNEIFRGANIAEFARQNDLSNSGLGDLVRGKIDYFKGWRRVGKEDGKHRHLIHFELEHKDGRKVEGANLKEFASKNGLDYDCLQRVVSGTRKQHLGWQLKGTSQKQKISKPLHFKIVDPVGKVYEGENLKSFCKEHGLNYLGVIDTLKGMTTHYKGWKFDLGGCYSVDRKYSLKSPEGVVHIIRNLKEFCLEKGLNYACLYRVANSQEHSYKKWTLATS